MVEPYKDPLGYKTKKLTMIIISVVGVAAVVVGGWIGINLSNYRKSGGPTTDMYFPGQVTITYPQHGMQLEVGEVIMVEASAIGPNPISSLELWLNGSLVGLQEVSGTGKQAFDTSFSWQLVKLGVHSLIAVAVDNEGHKVHSTQVVVIVSQGERAIELASLDETDSPHVFPVPPGGGSGQPDEPGGGEPIGQAEIWRGTIGNWINSLLADDQPAAPDLVVRSNQCTANLLIRDLSDNEEGFVVYRQMENSPDWIEVAKLSSQSSTDWIMYSDEGVSGLVAYYVTAFNSGGEVESNLISVYIDPADCPSEQEGFLVESVQATLQLTGGPMDKVYCYQSSDGVHWSRWPIAGFLSTDNRGYLPEAPLALLRKDLTADQSEWDHPGLMMDCWGWSGGELRKIGDLSTADLVPNPDGKDFISGSGLRAEIAFSVDEVQKLSDLFPSQLNTVDDYQSKLPTEDPISPEIPKVILSVTSDRNLCIAHLPPSNQTYFEQLEGSCYLFPEYDPDQGGLPPQPYLVWDFDPVPVCVGSEYGECKTYQELLELAEENGGQVGFTILSLRGGKKTVWNLTEPDLTTFVVPPVPCIGETTFSVRMWYRPGKESVEVSAAPNSGISEIGEVNLSIPETFYGPYSNWVTVPCNSVNSPTPEIYDLVQWMDITFDLMTLSSIDDDDHGGTEVVELYGNFYVVAPTMGVWVEAPCIFGGIDGCMNEEQAYMQIGRTRRLLLEDWGSDEGPDFIDGVYPLEYEKLCQSTKKNRCNFVGDKGWDFYNNTIRIYHEVGVGLVFGVRLYDYDHASYDDPVCIPTIHLFSGVPQGEFTLFSNTDSGKCWVNVRIEHVGEPVQWVIPEYPE